MFYTFRYILAPSLLDKNLHGSLSLHQTVLDDLSFNMSIMSDSQRAKNDKKQSLQHAQESLSNTFICVGCEPWPTGFTLGIYGFQNPQVFLIKDSFPFSISTSSRFQTQHRIFPARYIVTAYLQLLLPIEISGSWIDIENISKGKARPSH